MFTVFCTKCKVPYNYYSRHAHASRPSCRFHDIINKDKTCKKCHKSCTHSTCYHTWEYTIIYYIKKNAPKSNSKTTYCCN